MQGVGFEPTPPKRLVPETSALDHSATLACYYYPVFFLRECLSDCSTTHYTHYTHYAHILYPQKTTVAGFEPAPPEEK